MNATPQTIQQVERAIRRIAEKFPSTQEAVMTDVHLQVKPSSGELVAFDDNDDEITRVVVEQWIGAGDETFYEEAAELISRCIGNVRESIVDAMSVMRPFSFVLVDEDKETLHDLYLVDDDTFIIHQGLLEGLDEELDQFLKDLLKR